MELRSVSPEVGVDLRSCGLLPCLRSWGGADVWCERPLGFLFFVVCFFVVVVVRDLMDQIETSWETDTWRDRSGGKNTLGFTNYKGEQ